MGRYEFLYKSGLPHRAIAVYLYLSDRADKGGKCFPAIPTIARHLSLSVSTVKRGIADLRQAGYLTTKQRYRENGGKSSLEYAIIRPP